MENNYIKRKIDNDLTEWKNSKGRMPLLLRGARQVGKSSSVRNFAGGFDSFVEINFEKNKKARKAFEGDLIPQEICTNLSYIFNRRCSKGKHLPIMARFCVRRATAASQKKTRKISRKIVTLQKIKNRNE